MKGFLFAPPVTRHPIWKPALGQTTTVVTTTTSGATGITENQSAGADMVTLLVVTGAVLVVTEALGVTHVTKWFSKTLGLSKKQK